MRGNEGIANGAIDGSVGRIKDRDFLQISLL